MQIVLARTRAKVAGAISALVLMAPARAGDVKSQASIDIKAPLEKVWGLIASPGLWPQWYPSVESVDIQGPLQIGTSFVWKSKGFRVRSTLTQMDVNRTLSWSGEALGTNAVHEWHFSEQAGVVTVRTVETFSGWLPYLLPKRMQETLDQTLPNWLQALKLRAERLD